MSTIRSVQRTVFGKGGSTHAVLERNTANRQMRKASPNQLANFNDRNHFKALAASPSNSPLAKTLAVSRIFHQADPDRNRHSKWFMHCKRLEAKTLKENAGLEERLMRSRQSMDSMTNEFEDHRDKKKKAPDSRLISELKGVPEKGKLARPTKEEDKRGVQRVQKMGERVRVELIREITSNNVPGFDYDARVGRPEIIDVVMSSDLRRAKVLWAPPVLAASDPRVIKDWGIKFETARGYLRNMLGTRIRTRFVPELEFRLDTVQERIDHPGRSAGMDGDTVDQGEEVTSGKAVGKKAVVMANENPVLLDDDDDEDLIVQNLIERETIKAARRKVAAADGQKVSEDDDGPRLSEDDFVSPNKSVQSSLRAKLSRTVNDSGVAKDSDVSDDSDTLEAASSSIQEAGSGRRAGRRNRGRRNRSDGNDESD